MDNGSQTALALVRLPEGGYVVQEVYGFGNQALVLQQHFASTGIDEALKFMRAKILPVDQKAKP